MTLVKLHENNFYKHMGHSDHSILVYSKTCLKWTLKRKTKNCLSKTDYRLMRVKSSEECSKHSVILLTFIKLPFVFKTFVLSSF